MFDANLKAFLIVAGALVISPGATMAVVTEVALERGRAAALLTVLGVNIANSSLGLASMFGLSAVLHHWPSVLRAISVGGAFYLTYLGLKALWKAVASGTSGRSNPKVRTSANRSSAVLTGILTNFLNPSVVLFYMLLLPQFIAASDPFIRRFLILATIHVSMSLAWLTCYAIAVASLSERMERPWIRSTLEASTGLILVALGIRLVLR